MARAVVCQYISISQCRAGWCISSGHTVDLHLAVRDNLLDLSLLLEVLEAAAGERAVDLEPVDEGSDGYEAVGLDILVELVGSGLVEDDGVLGLILDYFGQEKMSAISPSHFRSHFQSGIASAAGGQ